MILSASRVITGDGKTVLEEHAVRVRDGKIRAVGPRRALIEAYPGEAAEHFENATLLPGLIDLHVHLGGWSGRPFDFRNNDFTLALVTARNARGVFRHGVTTLRDVASKNLLTSSLAAAVEDGVLEGPMPRMIPCGNGICMTGGHGSEFPGGGEEVDGPWELRKVIRRNIKQGCQWIKILTSRRTHTPEFSQEELNAAADECHRVGKKIAVHAGMQPAIQMCIDAGFDTIEHGSFLTVEQACQMREKGLSWVPTITPYHLHAAQLRNRCEEDPTPANRKAADIFRAYDDAYREHFKALYDTDVRVGAGTDLSIEREGTPVAMELRHMVNYGVTPLEAIRVATYNGAAILGLSDETGLIREGLDADLLIVDGDSSTDIAALTSVCRVYRAGVEAYRR